MTAAESTSAGLGNSAPDLATARRVVRDVVGRSGSSFALGMRLLERPRREAMFALYAYCRTVDDIADQDVPAPEKLAALDRWDDELQAIFAGRPSGAISVALYDAVDRFGLPESEFHAILAGMRWDAAEAIRAPEMTALSTYARHVAGAVGIISVRIFGNDTEASREFAILLGEALQFTNILRDVDEDARRGRLYLPREGLEAHGVSWETPMAALSEAGLPAVCADLAAVARERFASAHRVLQRCNRRRLRPAMVMMAGYECLLEALCRRGWNAISEPVVIPVHHRMGAVGRALLQSLR